MFSRHSCKVKYISALNDRLHVEQKEYIAVITPSLDGDHEKKSHKLLMKYVGVVMVKVGSYVGYFGHQLQFLQKKNI